MAFIKLFILLFFVIQLSSVSFSDIGNTSIHNFSKSKKILSKIHEEHPITFYCQCKYDVKKPDFKSCGYIPKNNNKRASRIEWEHILPASHFGVNFNAWNTGHPHCPNNKGKSYKGRKCTEKIQNHQNKTGRLLEFWARFTLESPVCLPVGAEGVGGHAAVDQTSSECENGGGSEFLAIGIRLMFWILAYWSLASFVNVSVRKS